MNAKDISDILAVMPKFALSKPVKIGKEQLLAKARAMALRGFDHSAKTLEVLEAYLQGYGILLSGGVGVGKSYFFECVEPEPLPVLSFNSCALWKYDAISEWLADHRNQDIVLDDVGWDAELGNNYGTKFEVLQIVLDERLRQNGRTHITTNLTNDELIVRYDAHLIDRIYQLCKCFALPSQESKRDARPNWTYIKNQEYAREMGKEVL